jgi:hypothetical protein
MPLYLVLVPVQQEVRDKFELRVPLLRLGTRCGYFCRYLSFVSNRYRYLTNTKYRTGTPYWYVPTVPYLC